MRLLLASITLAAATAVAPPATAVREAILLHCVVTTTRFLGPASSSAASGSCTLTGPMHGELRALYPASVSLDIDMPVSTCPVLMLATGPVTSTGPDPYSFTLTMRRYGAALYVTTTGDLAGRGSGTINAVWPPVDLCHETLVEEFVVVIAEA